MGIFENTIRILKKGTLLLRVRIIVLSPHICIVLWNHAVEQGTSIVIDGCAGIAELSALKFII